MEDIKLIYNARKHPAVEKGEKTQEEVLRDFLNNFDANRDGTLSYEEFEKVCAYACESCSCCCLHIIVV